MATFFRNLGEALDVRRGRRPNPTRVTAAVLVLVAAAVMIVGGIVFHRHASGSGILATEFDPTRVAPLPASLAGVVYWDFFFLACWGLALCIGLQLARAVFFTSQARCLLNAAALFAAGAVVADGAQDALLLGVAASLHGPASAWLTTPESVFAILKFCCLLPAGIVALLGLLATVWRLAASLRKEELSFRWMLPPAPLENDPPAFPPVRDETSDATRWARGYVVPDITDADLLDRRQKGALGICLSGGGVRSACVALGAMQTLRPELRRARYLVSVSGGGYFAGALQLAVTDAVPPDTPAATVRQDYGGTIAPDPNEAYMPGSVEADRMRRRVSYLADSPRELVLALGVLVRGLVVTVLLLLSTAVVVGVAVGRAYQAVPLYPWNLAELHPSATHLRFGSIRSGALWLLAALAIVAAASYLLALAVNKWPRLRVFLQRVSKAFTGLVLLVAVITVVAPAMIFGGVWLMWKYGGTHIAVGGSIGTLLLTYAASLTGLATRGHVIGRAKKLAATGGRGGALGGALQLLLGAVTLLLLAFIWLLLLCGSAAVSNDKDAAPVALGLLAVLIVLGGVLDQTELSLHPFYRHRLAKAFAARRIRREDGYLAAVEYPYTEQTLLSTYAKRADTMPQLVFAAAANLTGEQRAPLSAASFVFTDGWVGGPDVGYVGTQTLVDNVSKPIQRDLTVQAAVAVSGAAVASAMGRASKWFGALLAISGVRLGTWLPNPAFLAASAGPAGTWQRPNLPRIRRLTYLLREILDIHQASDRLLQITDGGHYENLGLVELFRRRCTEIYCIDASGDAPPTASTLAAAITLAREELGVEVVFDQTTTTSADGPVDVWRLVPGSTTTPLEPHDPLSALNSRLSDSATVTATVRYPSQALDGTGGEAPACLVGRLVVAKALITADMDYSLLSYAARDATFPHVTTADQFFDDDKFCAYSELGRQLGLRAKRAMTPEEPPPPAPAETTHGPRRPFHERRIADGVPVIHARRTRM